MAKLHLPDEKHGGSVPRPVHGDSHASLAFAPTMHANHAPLSRPAAAPPPSTAREVEIGARLAVSIAVFAALPVRRVSSSTSACRAKT